MVARGHVRIVLLVEYEPARPGVNRGIWRQLEARVRDWADLYGEIFVVTGPVLEGELPTIGPSGVSVPCPLAF